MKTIFLRKGTNELEVEYEEIIPLKSGDKIRINEDDETDFEFIYDKLFDATKGIMIYWITKNYSN